MEIDFGKVSFPSAPLEPAPTEVKSAPERGTRQNLTVSKARVEHTPGEMSVPEPVRNDAVSDAFKAYAYPPPIFQKPEE